MCLSRPTKPFIEPTEPIGPCSYREIAGWDADGNVIELDPPAPTIIYSPTPSVNIS